MQPQVGKLRRAAYKPAGLPRIDWGHPLAWNLSFAHLFDVGGLPLFLGNGATVASYQNSSIPKIGSQGTGMGGVAGFWGADSGSNTYVANTTAGSFLIHCFAGFASSDTNNHVTLSLGKQFLTGPNLNSTITAGNFQGGWWNGSTDARITAGVSFAAGTANTHGITYDTTTTTAYFNGVSIGTHATPTLGSTVGSIFNVGQYDTFDAANCFFTTASDRIYAAFIWDRKLSPSEMQAISADPYCFLIWSDDDLFASMLVGVASAPFLWQDMAQGTLQPLNRRTEMVPY